MMPSRGWRKSSHSTEGTSDQCVEVASLANGVGVRDSKAPEAGYLALSPAAFAELVAWLKGDVPIA